MANGYVNVALFGFGRAGKIHFKNLRTNPRVEVKYIVEEYPSAAEKAVVDYRMDSTSVVHSSERMSVFNDTSIQACVIATPTGTHEELVLGCLQAGKAVFCEKPLANSIEAIVKCYDQAKKKNLPLICSFNRRFDPGLRDIQIRTKAGEVGQVQMVKLTSRDASVPSIEYVRNSQGIYHDCAIHDLDLLLWLYSERPVSVYTTAHSFIKEIGDVNDHDNVAIMLKFPSGGIGLVDISRYASYGYDQRLEVFGDKGMLVQQNYKPTSVEFSGVNGSTSDRLLPSFPERYAASYIAAMNHFLDVVQGKCTAEIIKEGTLLACEVADACEKSLATGQAVKLSQ